MRGSAALTRTSVADVDFVSIHPWQWKSRERGRELAGERGRRRGREGEVRVSVALTRNGLEPMAHKQTSLFSVLLPADNCSDYNYYCH